GDTGLTSTSVNGLISTTVQLGIEDPHDHGKHIAPRLRDLTELDGAQHATRLQGRVLRLETMLQLDPKDRPNTYIVTSGKREYLTPALQAELQELLPQLKLDAITRLDPHAMFDDKASYALKQMKDGKLVDRGDPGNSLKGHFSAHHLPKVFEERLKPTHVAEEPIDLVLAPQKETKR
ncbi:MAG: hypothetical protein K2Q01_02640, partial [Rickettsiales bacterium]|nr:hypothetical protein [Rickettsiales bacterium]